MIWGGAEDVWEVRGWGVLMIFTVESPEYNAHDCTVARTMRRNCYNVTLNAHNSHFILVLGFPLRLLQISHHKIFMLHILYVM